MTVTYFGLAEGIGESASATPPIKPSKKASSASRIPPW